MDDQIHANGVSTADVVHKRADLRHLLEDVQKLPETQRTALLLREIDDLSYDQIAETMDTTVPSVKSLLVRARMSLAEAAEARKLSCDDVRRELAEIAEGLQQARPRRCGATCASASMCRSYRKELRKTTTAMALAFPVGPSLILKKLALAKLGWPRSAAARAARVARRPAAGRGRRTAAAAVARSGRGCRGRGRLGRRGDVQGVAGIAVTAILAGGAVEAKQVTRTSPPAGCPRTPPPSIVHSPKQTTGGAPLDRGGGRRGEGEGQEGSLADKARTKDEAGPGRDRCGRRHRLAAARVDPDHGAPGGRPRSSGKPGEPGARRQRQRHRRRGTDHRTGGARLPPPPARPPVARRHQRRSPLPAHRHDRSLAPQRDRRRTQLRASRA